VAAGIGFALAQINCGGFGRHMVRQWRSVHLLSFLCCFFLWSVFPPPFGQMSNVFYFFLFFFSDIFCPILPPSDLTSGGWPLPSVRKGSGRLFVPFSKSGHDAVPCALFPLSSRTVQSRLPGLPCFVFFQRADDGASLALGDFFPLFALIDFFWSGLLLGCRG